MGESIRLCVFRGASNVLELLPNQESGINSDGPRYRGPLAEAFNLNIEAFLGRKNVNYTMVVKDLMGNINLNSGYYEEGSCLHSLQINESDLSLAFAFHPLMGKNLKQYQPYVSDNIYIFSRYNVSTEVKEVDFMSAFVYIFSTKVWMLLLFFSLIFWMLLKTNFIFTNSFRVRRKFRDDSLYRVLTTLFQVDYFAFESVAMRIVSFLMTLLSFYILTYFTLSMKTDIVVVVEPSVVNSYDDLLARPRIKMIFPRMIDNFQRFELADPETKELKLWQKSLKEFGGDREQMLMKVSGQDMMETGVKMGETAFDSTVETVAIVSEISQRAVRFAACLAKVFVLYRTNTPEEKKKRGANFYSWTAKDPKSQEYILSAVHSGHFNSPPYLEKLYKRTSWAHSMGLMMMVQFNLNKPPVELIKIANTEEGDTYRDCLADNYRSNLPHVSHAAFKPVQFTTLMYISSGLVVAATIFIRIEIHINRKLKTLRRKRRMASQIIALHRLRGYT